MAGWHHWLDGRESEWPPGDGDGQGGLAYCDSWGRRVGYDWATELNWTTPILALIQENGTPHALMLTTQIKTNRASWNSDSDSLPCFKLWTHSFARHAIHSSCVRINVMRGPLMKITSTKLESDFFLTLGSNFPFLGVFTLVKLELQNLSLSFEV